MTVGRKEGDGKIGAEEQEVERVVKIPELTKEAEERIFSKIQASIWRRDSEFPEDDEPDPDASNLERWWGL